VAVLILLRHGRTGGNAAGLLQGRIDNPLDEVGIRQAQQVAAALGPVDEVISSSLTRAVQTAAMFGMAPTIDDRWIELDYGELDGRALGDVPAEAWTAWRSDPTFAPPGGESMLAMDQRVRAAALDALELARDRTVVVVSHVSPIKAAMSWALGGDISMSWRCHLDQAGVCRIAAGPAGPILRSFNEVLYQR
jgi:broad specificity phosphatase PhoE